MANYLSAHPADADFVDRCRRFSDFIPTARKGRLVGSVSPHSPDLIVLPDPMTAEEYVVGQELLGHTFHLVRMEDGRVALMQNVGLIPLPPAWRDYAGRLCDAFNDREHLAAIRDYLVMRGDAVMGDAMSKVGA